MPLALFDWASSASVRGLPELLAPPCGWTRRSAMGYPPHGVQSPSVSGCTRGKEGGASQAPHSGRTVQARARESVRERASP